jgi:hypothetical protein
MQLARAASALAFASALLAAGDARAYPKFQFSTDNARCNLCHVAPAGGGLLNAWGREEAADTISMGDSESLFGDPRALNGLWEPPSWFAFGGDYRGAFIVKDAPGQEPEALGFPMQADLYTNFSAGDFTLALIVGARGAARDQSRPPVSERIVSREHYLMWRPKTTGPYARVGRFSPVYGLRTIDHTAYIRRRLDLHILEEPYSLAGGFVRADHELHATVFTPSPAFSAGRRATGGAVYYERRVRDSKGAWGAQAKVDFTAEDARYLLGGVAKLWLPGPKLLLLAELDLGVRTFRTSGPTIGQLAAYAGVTYFPRSWLLIGSALERYDNDLALERSSRDSVNLTLQFFPRAHWELMLMGKLEVQGDDHNEPNGFGMFMLHYYL